MYTSRFHLSSIVSHETHCAQPRIDPELGYDKQLVHIPQWSCMGQYTVGLISLSRQIFVHLWSVKVPETEVITEANACIEPNFSVVEHPLRALDQKERQTRRHTVKMYKIQCSHHTEEEVTWETEHFLNTKYPGFLQSRNSKNLTPTFVFIFRISGRDSF
jgi:hypothetical protein